MCAGFFTQGPTQATRLSDSPVRWIGDESGLPNAPDIWSTAAQQNDSSGVGDPRSSVFAPAGCDSVFQDGGWFWEPGGVRDLDDLQLMYVRDVDMVPLVLPPLPPPPPPPPLLLH